ncbi:MAG: hypothetical protein IJT71_03765 [Oscillospiraceae bacterium]|nr:hypothetical protein [Oscillospiraceae bacterium]
MTDFIHEHPKDAPAAPTPSAPELDEKTGQKRVYGYIFLLFIVAFSLLVWAFLMNQRGTDRVLTELRGNADAMQSTLARNVELEQQADELERRLAESEAARETLERENAALREENAALREAAAAEEESETITKENANA